MHIITKIKKANLLGRGGASFPAALKWEMVKKAKAERKYIICNASEGEPDVFKDGFILKNYPEKVVGGIKIALKTIDNSSAYIYLRKEYYQKFDKKLIKDSDITLFKKPGGYLAGEETSLLEAIEGKRPEPRMKPPFPTEVGLFSCPTIINNVETFYYIAKIAENDYHNTRFYSIKGKKKGVFELPIDYSIYKILEKTGNLPKGDFFVQVGGGAVGEILLPEELDQPVRGAGSIIVFDRKKTNLFTLMEKWTNFFLKENCDKCTPCREGVYRIAKMVEKKSINKEALEDILFVLQETSFCPLGKSIAVPFKSLINKLLHVSCN